MLHRHPAVAGVSRLLRLAAIAVVALAAAAPSRADDPKVLNGVIERYLTNMRLTKAAAREFGTRAVFVWQPVPISQRRSH